MRPGDVFANRFVIANDPTTFIIDRSGDVRFIHSGYRDGEIEDIAREVESLL